MTKKKDTSKASTSDSKPTLEQLRQSQEDYINRHSGITPLDLESLPDEGKQALAAIKNADEFSQRIDPAAFLADVESKANQRQRHKVEMPFDFKTFKTLYWTAFKTEIAKKGNQVHFEPETAETITTLLQYYFGDQEGPLNLYKGIYLLGYPGRGKTIFMNTMRDILSTIQNRMHNAGHPEFDCQAFRIVNAVTLSQDCERAKSTEPIKKYFRGTLCIDDLGFNDSAKIWGDAKNICELLLVERYQEFDRLGIKTHATSNISPDYWPQLYGDRIESRMHEMFNIVILPGDDKRML